MASNFSTSYSDPEKGMSFAKRQDDMLDLDAIIEQLGVLESQLSYRECEIQATADASRIAERSVQLDEELTSVLQELNDLQSSGDYTKNYSDCGSVEPSSPNLDDGDPLHSSYLTLNGVQPSFPCSESKRSFGTLSSQSGHSSSVSTDSGKSAQTLVRVYSTDGSCKTVAVDDQTTVGKVCEVLAKKNRVEMPLNWAIVEYIPMLHMERILEDHLLILDQLNLWTKDSKNRLVFTEKPEKYSIFNNPELRDAAAKGSYSPDVDGSLYFKLDGKKAWKKIFFVLRASGLYYNPKGKGKSASDLICLQPLKGFDFYFGLDWKKYYKAPTEYGFALKMPMIQKEVPKFIRFFCLDDRKTLMDWATAFRLVKHGSQLHGSFVRTQSWIMAEKHMRQTKMNPHCTTAPVVRQSSECQEKSNGSSLSEILSDTESDVVFTHSRKNSTEYGTLKKSVPNLPITTSLTRHLSIQQQNFARTLPRSSARSAAPGSREDASPRLPSNDGNFMKFPSPDFSLDREDVETEMRCDVSSGFLRSSNGAPHYATQSLRNRKSPNKYQTLSAAPLQKDQSPNFRSPGGSGSRLPPTITHSQSSNFGFGSQVSPGVKLNASKSFVQDKSNSLDDVFDSYGYLASTQAVMNCHDFPPPPLPPPPSSMMLDGGGVVAFDQNLPLPPPPPELMSAASDCSSGSPLHQPQLDSGFPMNGNRRVKHLVSPTPPVRSAATRLSVRCDNPRTRYVIRDLDRVMTQKHEQGADGLSNLEIPLPPLPPSSEEDYLDVDPYDLPPPPAEILQSLKSMRNRPLPPVPTLSPLHRPAFSKMA